MAFMRVALMQVVAGKFKKVKKILNHNKSWAKLAKNPDVSLAAAEWLFRIPRCDSHTSVGLRWP